MRWARSCCRCRSPPCGSPRQPPRPRVPSPALWGEGSPPAPDQGLGRKNESIRPRLPLPSYMAERRFTDPIALESDVLGALGQLARELGHVLERRGEGARLLQAVLFRADGKVYRLGGRTGQPLRGPQTTHRLFLQ